MNEGTRIRLGLKSPKKVTEEVAEQLLVDAVEQVLAAAASSRAPVTAFSPALPLVQVPCLNQRVRQLLLMLGEMAAFIVHDTSVSVVLRSRTPGALQCAVELVTSLARWPGGSGQFYR